MKLIDKYPHIDPAEDLMIKWETQWGTLSVQEKAEAAEFYREAFYAVFSGDLPPFPMDVKQALDFEILYSPEIPKA